MTITIFMRKRGQTYRVCLLRITRFLSLSLSIQWKISTVFHGFGFVQHSPISSTIWPRECTGNRAVSGFISFHRKWLVLRSFWVRKIGLFLSTNWSECKAHSRDSKPISSKSPKVFFFFLHPVGSKFWPLSYGRAIQWCQNKLVFVGACFLVRHFLKPDSRLAIKAWNDHKCFLH